MSTPNPQSDPANKRLFSHPRIVADLVRLLGDSWVDDLDFGRLERLPAEHVAEDLRKRLADMPWWVPFREDRGWSAGDGVLLHLEFQTTPDAAMADRLLTYAALLREDLRRSGWMSAFDGRVVAHLPLVVYNGRAPWRAPRRLATNADRLPRELSRLQPRFAYRLIKAQDYAGDEVADGNLTRAALALDAAPAAELDAALVRASALLAEAADDELRRSFEAWCGGVLAPRLGGRRPMLGNDEEKTMLAETLREWDEKNIEDGRREGREEGLEEKRALLCGQAGWRFGDVVSRELAGILADVEDGGELMRIGTLIVSCGTGSELLARAR